MKQACPESIPDRMNRVYLPHAPGQSILPGKAEHSTEKGRAFHREGQSTPLRRAEHSTEKGRAFR